MGDSYVADTYVLLREKADRALAAKLARCVGDFPRGPAGKAVVQTAMRVRGFSEEEISQATAILAAAGIR